jgi:hypothetical protein
MFIRKILQTAVMAILFFGCRKIEEIRLPQFTSFKIEAANNEKLLGQDLEAAIDGNIITLSVPTNIDFNVIPSFVHTGDEVTLNNLPIQSGITSIKLDSGTVLTLKKEGVAPVNYVVQIGNYEETEFNLEGYIIEKKNNPAMVKDIFFEVKEDSIKGRINMAFKEAIPSLITNASKILLNGVEQVSGVTSVDFSKPIKYTLQSSKGFKKSYEVAVELIPDTIPTIYIETVGNLPITSKEEYLNASIKIEGKGLYEDYEGTTRIKGRGNSTWGYQKKPYRLKLDNKASLFGLSAEKDWVLLANYLDPTLSLNAVAMKIAKQLGIPYTNNIVPVDLVVNGVYMGSYSFTEQVEVESNRVDVTDGVLLEMDTYFDEPYKFKSTYYNLPVMIKYPDLTSDEELVPIENHFNEFESLLTDKANFPNNNYLDYFDGESLVNYIIVYLLTDNEEINHPKSTYIHRKANGKYTMGPVWDFDWAYGYSESRVHFTTFSRPLFWHSTPDWGTKFFTRFLEDPKIVSLLKQKWSSYKANKLSELIDYVESYARKIEDSRNLDYQKWKTGNGDFWGDINALKTWLQNRAGYIDSYLNTL